MRTQVAALALQKLERSTGHSGSSRRGAGGEGTVQPSRRVCVPSGPVLLSLPIVRMRLALTARCLSWAREPHAASSVAQATAQWTRA